METEHRDPLDTDPMGLRRKCRVVIWRLHDPTGTPTRQGYRYNNPSGLRGVGWPVTQLEKGATSRK